MGRDKRNEKREEQFTKWVLHHRKLPAWRALGFPAREAYFHLQIRCFAETAQKNPRVANNNGEVYRSPRDVAKDIGCNPKTAMAAFADLQAKGWLVCTAQGKLGRDGRGTTARFRLTMLSTGQGKSHKSPNKEPKQWREGHDYEVVAYPSCKPKGRKGDASKLKKQIPAPVGGAALHQLVVHDGLKTREPAPVCGSKPAKLSPSAAPRSGAYLITISPKVLGG